MGLGVLFMCLRLRWVNVLKAGQLCFLCLPPSWDQRLSTESQQSKQKHARPIVCARFGQTPSLRADSSGYMAESRVKECGGGKRYLSLSTYQ